LEGGGAVDDDDAKTAITSKSFRGLSLKKKEKMKIKKEFWSKSEPQYASFTYIKLKEKKTLLTTFQILHAIDN
jgi:hypothetical protein